MARKGARRLWLILGGVTLVLLAAAVFTLGSLRAPVRPERGNAFVVLFALSTFIFAAFLIFGLILARSFVRLWTERRAGQLGSRFKTKMLFGAAGVSLLPVAFLFFFSYALLNRTLNLWFPRPLENAAAEGRGLLDELQASQLTKLHALALQAAARQMASADAVKTFGGAVDAAWRLDTSGRVTESEEVVNGGLTTATAQAGTGRRADIGRGGVPWRVRLFPGGGEIWQIGIHLYLAAGAPESDGAVMVAQRLPDDFLVRATAMEQQGRIYEQQREQIRTYKKQILLALLLVTLLLLSTSTWVALFLAKLVTVPIQAMAEATQEVARGNFDYRVSVQAHDELGTLVTSFNQMTAQLGDSRRQIDEFTRNLQVAFEERERRRQLMEAILENIPTGVISLSPQGEISRVNAAAVSILGGQAGRASTLEELVGEGATRDIQHLMRRALRLGVASREMELPAPGRYVNAAVTVSALGTRRDNPGYLLVVDDLTELLRAQKAAAWQEVARRIAHEIKNPLTPIQLSAQRLLRHLERVRNDPAVSAEKELPEFTALVAECSSLIEQEVTALATLVDEFSQFVRFPAAQLEPSDINAIVTGALDSFRGRLEGITLRAELAEGLPAARADAELLRRVIVNLVDNAAEALEDAAVREIEVSTRLDARGEGVEIIVADTGRGISPKDKDRLFLPQFSTKGRGTGLGLAIASRIVTEHNGTLRAEDNVPMGSRFIIHLPAADGHLPAIESPIVQTGTRAGSAGEA